MIMKQLLSAVNYCHLHKIIHQNIRPDKIVLSHPNKLDSLKLIGLERALMVEAEGRDFMRHPSYLAPEVFTYGGYIQQSDIWSCGVIMYVLLSGNLPFKGPNSNDIIDKIINFEINLDEPQWQSISENAIDLLAQLLNPDPSQRFSAEEALQHPWIIDFAEKESIGQESLAQEVLTNLAGF